MSSPCFANCRLHLPCIAFCVTVVRRSRPQDQDLQVTYEVKAEGLHDLLITTEDKLIPSSWIFTTRQMFFLIRPLAELPGVTDDAQDETYCCSAPGTLLQDSDGGSLEAQESTDLESSERELRLIDRLGQPFSSFLVARQRGGEYKRIASDHAITASH
ncbi:hypothetical protein BDR04DRAFT_1233770 [Suillus decipiens]|nr:hypothetical protein BDR04DRAFT_1233770 [Suillus decipiens]